MYARVLSVRKLLWEHVDPEAGAHQWQAARPIVSPRPCNDVVECSSCACAVVYQRLSFPFFLFSSLASAIVVCCRMEVLGRLRSC